MQSSIFKYLAKPKPDRNDADANAAAAAAAAAATTTESKSTTTITAASGDSGDSGAGGTGSSSLPSSSSCCGSPHSHLQPQQKRARFNVVVDEILHNSLQFGTRIRYPVSTNLIRTQLAAEPELAEFIAEAAQSTLPIVHDDVWTMLAWFIEHKSTHGSAVENAFYTTTCTTPQQLLVRLLTKRPVMFMTSADSSVLRDDCRVTGGFTTIGSEAEEAPLLLADYISYDEIQLAALVSMFVPTLFINDGRRNNEGRRGKLGTFERKGVYVGMVGARFERPGLMEWEHMVVDPTYATSERGYGLELSPDCIVRATALRRWAELYKFQMQRSDGSSVFCFPTYEEARQLVLAGDERFHLLSHRRGYLNIPVYKTRLRMILEPFLLHANEYADMQQKRAWLHVVGLGLGVWELASIQAELMVQVYDELLSQMTVPHISDIVFGYFSAAIVDMAGIRNGELYEKNGNSIRVHFSRSRSPADPIDTGKVLVAQYAWDGNSYPGNEYWIGALSASGDPAAAACSLIPELQNPEVNPHMTRSATLWPSQRIESLLCNR